MFQMMILKFTPLDSATYVIYPQLAWTGQYFGTFTLMWTVTCGFVEKKQKGGRPKKLKRGKRAGGSKTTEGTTGAKELPRETVLNITRKIEEIESASTVSHRLQNPKYKFSEQVKEDFYCPICKDVLFQPVETFCEHYFCGGCFKQAMLSSGIPLGCPVCKTELNAADHITRPPRMVLRLIAELKVKCNNCGCEFSYEDQSNHLCEIRAGPAIVAHPIPVPDPPAQNPITLEEAMEELRQGNISPEMEKMGTLFVKNKTKSSEDGKTALLKTRGKVI